MMRERFVEHVADALASLRECRPGQADLSDVVILLPEGGSRLYPIPSTDPLTDGWVRDAVAHAVWEKQAVAAMAIQEWVVGIRSVDYPGVPAEPLEVLSFCAMFPRYRVNMWWAWERPVSGPRQLVPRSDLVPGVREASRWLWDALPG